MCKRSAGSVLLVTQAGMARAVVRWRSWLGRVDKEHLTSPAAVTYGSALEAS